ncbi:MAG: hypothetical protein KDD66_07590 [Bdellovibrionales bacterium]|nr:hypothetical protein [Bdellovibrionales bacterium]
MNIKLFNCIAPLMIIALLAPANALALDVDEAIENLINTAGKNYSCICCDQNGCHVWSGSLTDDEKTQVEQLTCDKDPGSVLEDELIAAVLGERHTRSRGTRGGSTWSCTEDTGGY